MARRRKRNKNWISWLILLVLLVGAGVVCYFVYVSYFKEEQKPTDGPAEENVILVEPEVEPETEPESAPVEIEKEKVVQYDGEDPNKAEALSGVVTYAGVTGGKLMIRVNINQFLSGGSCELNLMQGGTVARSESVQIIDSAATATCAGFDLAVSGLSGKYDIVIKLLSGDKTGTIRGEVNI